MSRRSHVAALWLMLMGFAPLFSGCALGIQGCDKYLGTAEYTECRASHGDQDAQFQLGRTAYEAGEMDEAVRWLKKAAKPQDNRTPFFIPKGNNGNFRIEMRETGLSKPSHAEAERLLERIEQ